MDQMLGYRVIVEPGIGNAIISASMIISVNPPQFIPLLSDAHHSRGLRGPLLQCPHARERCVRQVGAGFRRASQAIATL